MINQCKRLINFLVLFALCFLLIPVAQVLAEENGENLGEMELKIDRIIEGDSGNRQNTETELEKTFPELFKEETTNTIHKTQGEKSADLEKLKQELFFGNIGEYSLLEETRDSLFASSYTAPKIASDENAEEEPNSPWLNNALIAGLIALVFTVLGGIFALVRRLSD